MKNAVGLSLLSILLAVANNPVSAEVSNREITAPNIRIDTIFSEYTKVGSPGCGLGVFQDGKTTYEKGYGLASLEHGVEIDPHRTVFDIGSMSKQFTAASVLLLVQDGKLALSDNIRKYLPEIPDYGKTITVANLLHHTSGLRDYNGLMMLAGWDDADYTDEKDALAIIARQKALNFAPGSRFSYSNTGYFLLSLIVERASGKHLRDFAHDHIFVPLGMKDTLYLDDHRRVVPHRATAYEVNANGDFVVHMSNWEQTGDGAVQTTLPDLAKWQRNFDEPKVGGRWLVEQMETRGALGDGSAIGYGGGLFVGDYRGLPTIGHGGVWAGYRANLLRFPAERLSVVVLCNFGDAQAESLARQVADVYLEGRFSKVTETPTQEQRSNVASDAALPDAAGTYWSPEDAKVRRLEKNDGKLWYAITPKVRRELVPMGGGRFSMLGAPSHTEVQLQPSVGATQKFQLVTDTEKSAFQRVQEFVPDAHGLVEFVGTYSSAEINGARWTFAVDGDHLTLQAPREEPVPLIPMFKDAFLTGPFLLRFQRDASGRIASLLVDEPRMRNLIFERDAARSP